MLGFLEPDGFWPASLEFFVRRDERKIRPEELPFAGARRAIKELQTRKARHPAGFLFLWARRSRRPPRDAPLHKRREECGTHEFRPRPEIRTGWELHAATEGCAAYGGPSLSGAVLRQEKPLGSEENVALSRARAFGGRSRA